MLHNSKNQISFVAIKNGQVSIKSINSDANLSEALAAFEDFLRGAGYVFDGSVDVYGKAEAAEGSL